jgi:hypothetical protein
MSGHAAGELRSNYQLGWRPLGLWHSLIKVWMRNLGRRSMLNRSDSVKLHRHAAPPPYPLTADLAGVLAAERRERFRHPNG